CRGADGGCRLLRRRRRSRALRRSRPYSPRPVRPYGIGGLCTRTEQPIVANMFGEKDGLFALKGIAPDPVPYQFGMISNVADPGERILLCRMQSQSCWVQGLLTQFSIAGLNSRAFRFGTLAPIAFEGFSDGSKLALFIVESATDAVHLRVSLS